MDTLSKDSITSFLSQPGKVVVEFKADWCGDCRRVRSTYEKLATEQSPLAKFGQVDIDEERGLHDSFGITSIPDFRFMIDGKEVTRISEPSTDELTKTIHTFLDM